MIETEVLIVGGGPAGSSLAWALKRAGLSPVIMDKAQFPRQKLCAGWVTPAVMEELEIDIEEYAREFVLQPIKAFRTSLMGRQSVQSDFAGEVVSYGIRRVEFDNYLLRRCGAELRLGQKIATIRYDGGGWIINESIKAALLVGAGGHFCPVARLINRKNPGEIAVTAQEIEFEMSPEQAESCPVAGTTPELFFTTDLKGYGWVFRKGDYLNIGLGREDKRRLSGHVKRFCDDLAEKGLIPPDLPEKFKGHAYLLYPHAKRRLVDDGVMLIGDAAGLAYVQSGEGIRPAVESALLAAEVIRNCQGDYSSKQLDAYVDKLQQRFGQREPSGRLAGLMPAGLRQSLARWVLGNRWLSRYLLVKRWFLHTQDKPMNLQQ
jgi:flavin-dependent dehydrogenase